MSDFSYNSSSSNNQEPCFHSQFGALECVISNSKDIEGMADAVWFDIPNTPSKDTVYKFKRQGYLVVGFSMESAVYYPEMDEWKDLFDLMMTYRFDSDIVAHYFLPRQFQPENTVKFKDKLDSVAFMNRNCHPINNRQRWVFELSQAYDVVAYGSCLNNHRSDIVINKTLAFSRHKFCIAIENSNDRDYVTEKIWEAFEAGCLPIYSGAPNILDFLPSPKSAILVDLDKDPSDLVVDLLNVLAKNETRYNEYMKWKSLPLTQLSKGYQNLIELTHKHPSTKCQLCLKVFNLKRQLKTTERISEEK